ncbi:MAG TPA: Na+/H+ antiporter NhaC family protein [Rhodothermales bacterium]|nr:Na+/H+ antiporter NhaC family protein [Rhodothermales bacterium]
MGWIVLLPPILAIVLALWTRQVYLALTLGLWLGTTILVGGNPIAGLRELGEQIVLVFQDAGNTRVVIFCILVGGLVALVQGSGGVAGFIGWAQRRGWGASKRGAEMLAWAVGMLIFVESSITCLVVGAVSRPFFDRLHLPREKLAYYCDATSAPVCMMIPLNAWGAYVLGLLAAQGVTTGAVSLLAQGLLFNFYCILIILFTLLLAATGWGFGSMRRSEVRAAATGDVIRPGSRPLIAEEIAELPPVPGAGEHARNLLVPLLVMVGMIFLGLLITGKGNLTQGSGSTAVYWAVSTAIVLAMVLYAIPRRSHSGQPTMTLAESTDLVLRGCAGLVSVTVLIVLAFALGQVSRALEMGPYLVGLVGQGGPTWWLPGLFFVVACFISFTLGSSWATWAILIPIALPLAEGLGLPAGLMLGATLSGGVFGDHASPLSDTTIISSMSAACDHVDHVNTQLPYALLVAAVSLLGFLLAGALA